MYEYQYVTLERKGGFITHNSFDEYRASIDSYAARGWRYTGCIPVKVNSYGVPVQIDLIFEREVS